MGYEVETLVILKRPVISDYRAIDENDEIH